MRVISLGLCLALALASAAAAQPARPQQQGGQDMLVRLHEDLHLTADQEAAWGQYAAAMRNTGQMQARHQSTERMLSQLQTPRRLALLDSAMTADLADFHRQSQEILGFYNRLTPAQQRTFDRDTLPGQPEQ